MPAASGVKQLVLAPRVTLTTVGNRPHNARMLAHLVDLGDGAISVNVAKKVLLDDAGGVVARAQGAWENAGLPGTGTVTVAQLEKADAEPEG